MFNFRVGSRSWLIQTQRSSTSNQPHPSPLPTRPGLPSLLPSPPTPHLPSALTLSSPAWTMQETEKTCADPATSAAAATPSAVAPVGTAVSPPPASTSPPAVDPDSAVEEEGREGDDSCPAHLSSGYASSDSSGAGGVPGVVTPLPPSAVGGGGVESVVPLALADRPPLQSDPQVSAFRPALNTQQVGISTYFTNAQTLDMYIHPNARKNYSFYWKWSFPMSPSARLSVCWLDGSHDLKFHFPCSYRSSCYPNNRQNH